jgi:hypothetical protein
LREKTYAFAAGDVDPSLRQRGALGRHHDAVRQRLVGGNNFGLQAALAGRTATKISLNKNSRWLFFRFRLFTVFAAFGVWLRFSSGYCKSSYSLALRRLKLSDTGVKNGCKRSLLLCCR